MYARHTYRALSNSFHVLHWYVFIRCPWLVTWLRCRRRLPPVNTPGSHNVANDSEIH